MKNVLITGGTGALGRQVIAQLRLAGNTRIFCLSSKPQPANTSVQFLLCDLRDKAPLDAALDFVKPALIVHLAALFTKDFSEAYAMNVQPAVGLLEGIEKSGLKTRIILAGSAAEYGVVAPEENPLCEDRALFPVSVYGMSKAWQSQLVGLYAARGVDVVCARIFNLFGPGISEQLFAGRVDSEIRAIQHKKKSRLDIGPLSAVRDYLSTHDAACQLLQIAAYGKAGNVYHIASGKPVSMRDFLVSQLAEHGLCPSLIHTSALNSTHTGYDVPVIFASMHKTQQLLQEKNLCLHLN